MKTSRLVDLYSDPSLSEAQRDHVMNHGAFFNDAEYVHFRYIVTARAKNGAFIGRRAMRKSEPPKRGDR